MDLGNVTSNVGEDEWAGDYGDTGDIEVDAVRADSQCHNCHGWGHFAQDCPTKGKG